MLVRSVFVFAGVFFSHGNQLGVLVRFSGADHSCLILDNLGKPVYSLEAQNPKKSRESLLFIGHLKNPMIDLYFGKDSGDPQEGG